MIYKIFQNAILIYDLSTRKLLNQTTPQHRSNHITQGCWTAPLLYTKRRWQGGGMGEVWGREFQISRYSPYSKTLTLTDIGAREM